MDAMSIPPSIPPARDEDSADTVSSVCESEDENAGLAPEERLDQAAIAKTDGNDELKRGDYEKAKTSYKRGIKLLKDLPDPEVKKLRAQLNGNLSLAEFKSEAWWPAIRAATETLKDDATNVKALFRRGVARSRLGLCEEARADLLKVCKVDSANVEARRELDKLREQISKANAKDKQAYKGLFGGGGGLYADREKQMAELRKKEAEKLAKLKEEYEEEKSKHAGSDAFPTFEDWKKKKEEVVKPVNNKSPNKESKSSPTKSKTKAASTTSDLVLDEDDQKIIQETKKMGYCYFNRKVEEQPAAKTVPTPSVPSNETLEQVEEKRAISSWNAKGTTYEEKDVTKWAIKRLGELLKTVEMSSTTVPPTLAPATECTVTSVEEVEGEAQIAMVRGTKRYLYDFKATVHWAIETNDGPVVGKVLLYDMSSACSSSGEKCARPCVRVDWLKNGRIHITKAPNDETKSALEGTILNLKDAIYEKVMAFEAEFINA